MATGQRAETKTLDRFVAIAAATSGIGYAVSNKALTTNVATLTIGAHTLLIGDKVLIRGVDSIFDGVDVTLTGVTGTTISYALVHADVVSVAVTVVAGVSKRASIGYRRYSDAENFEAQIRLLTAAQGYFWAAIEEAKSAGLNDMKHLNFMGELVLNVPRVTNDLSAAWEIALGIRDALEHAENFQVGEFRGQISVKLREVGGVNRGGICVFDFRGIDIPYALP